MKIFIAEDDGVLRSGIAEMLSDRGYETVSASSYSEAENMTADEGKVSLFLIDIMLGDGSGISLIREIRKTNDAPIIVLSVLDGEDSVIEALSCGADDYVTKPFRTGELLARIAANIRRQNRFGDVITSKDIAYSLSDGRLFIRGEEKSIGKNEKNLLELFLKSGGRLLTRDIIFDSVWGLSPDAVDDNTLSVLISRLRKTLGKTEGRDYIETVRGVGYRWTAPCSSEGSK